MATKISDLTEQTVLADTDLFLTAQEDSNNKKITWKSLKDNFPFDNYINGFVLSNDSGDTEHDINITAGVCMDSTNGRLIRLSSEITKRADSAWSVGDDAGGMDTGTVTTSTFYYVYLIKRSDTGVVDVCISASIPSTGPTIDDTPIPTAYDYYRCIGFLRSDGSGNIINFKIYGNANSLFHTYVVPWEFAGPLNSTSYAAQSLTSGYPTASGLLAAIGLGADMEYGPRFVKISLDGTNPYVAQYVYAPPVTSGPLWIPPYSTVYYKVDAGGYAVSFYATSCWITR